MGRQGYEPATAPLVAGPDSALPPSPSCLDTSVALTCAPALGTVVLSSGSRARFLIRRPLRSTSGSAAGGTTVGCCRELDTGVLLASSLLSVCATSAPGLSEGDSDASVAHAATDPVLDGMPDSTPAARSSVAIMPGASASEFLLLDGTILPRRSRAPAVGCLGGIDFAFADLLVLVRSTEHPVPCFRFLAPADSPTPPPSPPAPCGRNSTGAVPPLLVALSCRRTRRRSPARGGCVHLQPATGRRPKHRCVRSMPSKQKD